MLTLRFLESLHEEGVGVIGFVHNKLPEEAFKELKHLLFLQVALNVLLVFKFLHFVHFQINILFFLNKNSE
jgi:hypothetical protein